MAIFRDPNAPEHRVVYGGVEFINQVTGDINPDDATRELFRGAGITEVKPDKPNPEPVQAPVKPAQSKKK